MRPLALAIRTIVWALAALGVGFIALRLGAPWPIDGNEADAALLTVAKAELSQRKRERIYVSFNGRDPSEQQIQDLRVGMGGQQVLPMSKRSIERDRCSAAVPNVVVIGACKNDDFIEIRFQAMPLWRVALVSHSTAACGAEFVLAKPGGTWLMVSTRWVCM